MSEVSAYEFGAAETPMDPRLPVIAQMAAMIYTEKMVYTDDREARRMAVDQAFLLYGEVSVRLAGNNR